MTGRLARTALSIVALIAAVLGARTAKAEPCAPDNGGLVLASDLCATVFADKLGQARHLAVTADGVVYVNTWRSPYKPNAIVPPGGWLVALRDSDGDGRADQIERFGDTTGVGGTGLAIHSGFLFAESNGQIVRYPLPATLAPRDRPAVIVDRLPMDGDHTMHSIAIGPDGALFVNSGAPSNACQIENRRPHSPGKDPCEELVERAGLWKYDANTTGQLFGFAERYVTGLRNTVGLAFHPTAGLFALQHGRDLLHQNWPERFSLRDGSELPAEILVRPVAGADYGWPYCYYDGLDGRYVLAPEYGGDGRMVGRCAGVSLPVAVFPAHWAPNALVFYQGGPALPQRYHGGAFIAFHGSFNRYPQQQGYNVVFVPPSGAYEVFADGFAGPLKTPARAAHRPTGLAVGPDGALYISDDQGGRIWRIARRDGGAARTPIVNR